MKSKILYVLAFLLSFHGFIQQLKPGFDKRGIQTISGPQNDIHASFTYTVFIFAESIGLLKNITK